MLIVSEAEVEQLLELAELRRALEVALVEFSAGHVTQPVRTLLSVGSLGGRFGVMPAVYGNFIGAKLVSVFPDNARLGLPTHNAMIQLFRADTGEPVAILGGRVITAWRTAAVSALATSALAPAHAETLAILGSGVQARSHFAALTAIRSFKEVRVWSRTEENTREFARETGSRLMCSAEAAVRDADVIATVTHSPTPILRAEWLKPHAHINAVGSVGPQFLEIELEAMRRAAVVVESREAALVEAGEIVQSGAQIYAELGEILAGSKPRPMSQLTIYKSLGIAVEDVAAAKLIYEKKLNCSAPENAPPGTR